jgi:DNA replication protein DnaC
MHSDNHQRDIGREMAIAVARGIRERRINEAFGTLLNTDLGHPDLAINQKQIETVLSWSGEQKKGLLLSGSTGTGKTRALALLCKRLHVDEKIPIQIWKSQALFSRIANELTYGRDKAEEFIAQVARVPVLVIDDLGQEATRRGADDFARQWFFALLDERYQRELPCLITTNHTAATLAEVTRGISGDPLIRRLLAVAEPVKFTAAAS